MIVKSAMTPSLRGLIAVIFPGVLPSMSLAVSPTASTVLPFDTFSRIATTDGSLRTTPSPLEYIRVLAVPKSIDKSVEK